jgi:hypothetical protein
MYRVHREFEAASGRSSQVGCVCEEKNFDRARSFVQIVAMGHYVD